jgi:hypothetical protein
MKSNENNVLKSLARGSLLTACAAALVACGGGGGSSNPPAQTLVDAPSITQGFWSGAVANGPDGATRASAVITPDLTAWVALEAGTGVVGVARMPLTSTATNATTASLSGSGSYYGLASGAAQAIAATGTVTASALNATTSGAAGGATLDWMPTTTPSYAVAASAADLAGNVWQGTAGGGAAVITWRPDAAGTLAGATSNSSTGCTYAGTVTPNAVAYYTVNVVEDCAGAQRTLSGIATLNAAKTRLNVVFTSDAGTRGGLIALTKQ